MDFCRNLLLVLLFLVQSYECGLFNWVFGSKNNELQTGSQKDPLDPAAIMASIPFELQTTDEKFLNQALDFVDVKMSELDKCHHKVILGLRKACAQLSEEEISKVSVNLLNCQSAIEGRPIYPCTNDMSLKDCTRNMNQDTWNAYHIVSNRARAVCYSSRQVQFRAKTEIAVNKLVSTAEQQIAAMDSLQQGQDKLGRATEDTLESISSGHRSLMLQQDMLKNAQNNIQWYVASNLRQLTREKALIAAGQKELADMTESIKDKLDIAGKQLANHEGDRKKNHDEILNDLAELQVKATSVWEKIENSTHKILTQHAESAEHYQTALDNLQRVNHSIVYLLKLVERTRSEIDEKLDWLTHLAGGTGNQLAMVLTVTLHLGYFLLGALAMSFVSAPPITRVTLLLAVPLNALNEIKSHASLDFVVLTAVIVTSAIVHWLVVFARVIWRRGDQLKNIKTFTGTVPGIGSTASHNDHQQSNVKPHVANVVNRAPQAEFVEDSSDDSVGTPEANPRIATKVLESVMSSVRKSFHDMTSMKGSRCGIATAAAGNDSFCFSSDSSSTSLPPSVKEFMNTSMQSPPAKRDEDLKNVRRHLMESLDENTSMPRVTRSSSRGASRSSTPLRSNTPTSTRNVCRGKLKSGLHCRRTSLDGENYCKLHLERDNY